MQKRNPVKIAVPILESFRTDTVRPQGMLLDYVNQLAEIVKTIEGNPFLAQRVSLLEGRWLLEDNAQNVWMEPADILEAPAAAIKALQQNLLVSRRYRNKTLLMQLVEHTDALYLRLQAAENRQQVLDVIGVELLAYLLDLFRVLAKPSLLDFIYYVNDRLYNYASFLQSMPVISASTPEVPEGTPKNSATQAYYERMHRLAQGECVANGVWSAALNYRATGMMRDVDSVIRGTKLLEKYHGTVHGAYTANDYLAGRCPNAATNILAACKYFMALQSILEVTQDISVANRMENIAVNLLIGYVKEGRIQVMQSSNQIDIDTEKDLPYAQVKSASFFAPVEKQEELTALCDCMNAFIRSLWLKKQNGGLVLMFPFASKICYSIDGNPVSIVINSKYPFEEEIEIIVYTKKTVNFPMYLRIPAFASQAVVSVNKEVWQPAIADSFYVVSRSFHNGDKIKMKLPLNLNMNKFYRRSCAVFRGPVLYALPQDAQAKRYDNYAIDGKSLPRMDDQDPSAVCVNAFPFQGEQNHSSNIALMPECDLKNPVELKLYPSYRLIGRIAQFATVDFEDKGE